MKTTRAVMRAIGILCLCQIPALATAAVEDNSILALEPQQGLIVVQTGAGKLEVIAIGDTLPDSAAVLREVLTDRAIAEEVVGEDRKTTQQVWIYKATAPGAGSRVERLLVELPQTDALSASVHTQGSRSPTPQDGDGIQ